MTGKTPEADEVIASERLRLVSMSPAFIEALLRGHHSRAAEIMGVEVPPEWPVHCRSTMPR